MARFERWYRRNEAAESLEEAGNYRAAANLLEKNVQEGADTPHTYRRLATTYRKHGDYENEARIWEAGARNVKGSSFGERAEKARALMQEKGASDRVELPGGGGGCAVVVLVWIAGVIALSL